MKSSSLVARTTFLALVILAAPLISSFGQTPAPAEEPTPSQPTADSASGKQQERFWIAGRYDGNRVIVYFDAVKFNRTKPSLAERLPGPVARGFFMPEKLPWAYVAKLQNGPDAEHFKMGDVYDLLLDEGKIAPVTLTTMIGTEGDEEVGNDSYIGALASLENHDDVMYFSREYYVIRRQNGPTPTTLELNDVHAGLERDPVRFDIQTEIVGLLTERARTAATDAQRAEIDRISPIVDVQAFRLSDGSLRYYAGAAWNYEDKSQCKTVYALGAWISPAPKLHRLEVQHRTSGYDGGIDLPHLLNVVDLGGGRTGIILSVGGEDSSSTKLVEYRDGLDFQHMRVLQSLDAGE